MKTQHIDPVSADHGLCAYADMSARSGEILNQVFPDQNRNLIEIEI